MLAEGILVIAKNYILKLSFILKSLLFLTPLAIYNGHFHLFYPLYLASNLYSASISFHHLLYQCFKFFIFIKIFYLKVLSLLPYKVRI